MGIKFNVGLEEAVREILASAPFQRIVPEGMAAAVWAASYAERRTVLGDVCLSKASSASRRFSAHPCRCSSDSKAATTALR